MCYLGGQGKGGRQQIQEVARYPNHMSQSSSSQYCGPVYPSLVLPYNRIHLKIGGCSTRPGKVLNILALPAEFPLALAFTYILSQAVANKQTLNSFKDHNKVLCALSTCLESLSKFINRIDCPIPLKEIVLHQLADIMWTLCCFDKPSFERGEKGGEKEEDDTQPKLYAIPSKFVQSAQQELLKLYEVETTEFTKGRSGDNKFSMPPPGSIGTGGQGRFSTYFQSLLEFVLAVLEYQHRFHGMDVLNTSSSTSLTNSSTSLPHLASPPVSTESSPTPPIKTATVTGSPSINEVSLCATPTSGAAPVSATPSTDPVFSKKPSKRTHSRKLLKKESSESAPRKDEWLNTLRQSTSVLRTVVLTKNAASCGSIQPPKTPSADHLSSRLIVLTGISSDLSLASMELSIRKVCKLYGGLYLDGLYLPAKESDPLQHNGHAVLELRCANHTSAMCSALLAAPDLQPEKGGMQAMAVNSSLSCGDQETLANKVLSAFLMSKLTCGGSTSPAVEAAMMKIFNSSCQEEGSMLKSSQVSGGLLKFFSVYAGVHGVSVETLIEGVWKDHGDQEGKLTLKAFINCCKENFILDDQSSVRGVWLGMIECGFDLHLDR